MCTASRIPTYAAKSLYIYIYVYVSWCVRLVVDTHAYLCMFCTQARIPPRPESDQSRILLQGYHTPDARMPINEYICIYTFLFVVTRYMYWHIATSTPMDTCMCMYTYIYLRIFFSGNTRSAGWCLCYYMSVYTYVCETSDTWHTCAAQVRTRNNR